jgi:S-DNA-T family DNA segregation ATPase FtsK/SpoIIIE
VASLFSSRGEDGVEEVIEEPVTTTRRRRADPPIEEFPVQTVEEYDESVLATTETDDAEVEAAEIEPNAPEPAPRRKKAAPRRVKGTWKLPDPAILQRIKEQKQDRSAIDAAGDELVDALAAHGVETTLVGYTIGPTVTRYELELGAGVKVAKVTSLNRDIAYAMASPDVRILAPIPGRSAIGVEVPNRQRTLVTLGDLLAADEAIQATHPLDVPLGRDISGTTVVVNLAAMPHVLISGATGAGKSSCINSLISSLVMRSTPDEVRLILVDPKRVELGQYNDLPHLLTPVVVDPRKAAGALAWAVREMERRYDILAEAGVRDITSYKELLTKASARPEPEGESANESDGVVAPAAEREDFPYIVIVVDELNDLMMVAARDVEESVVRIAQMARAVGIHLVLATQRPSVDVITGVIKANVPSRMAFAVSSLADSRVILDQAGAERLIGKGDMLLLTASSNVPRRLQSPWISEDEVRQLVAAWTSQDGQVELVAELEASVGGNGEGGFGGPTGDEDDDEMLRQARDLVVRTQSGSVSMLQRKLRVGFARAGRLMDMLENEGTVAAGEGSKSRQVLITLEEYEARQRHL